MDVDQKIAHRRLRAWRSSLDRDREHQALSNSWGPGKDSKNADAG